MEINKTYVVYVFSVFIAVLIFAVYSIFNHLNTQLDEEIENLYRQYQRLIKTKAEYTNLKNKIKELNIRPLSKEEAMEIILEKADKLVKMYDGKITEDIRVNDKTYSIAIKFDYYPENTDDLYNLLSSFNSSFKPIIFIKQFKILQTVNGSEIPFEIKLFQPFAGKKE